MRSNCGFLVALLAFVASAVPASAQTASRVGPSVSAIDGVVKGSAVAYDPRNAVYLVVSAYGPVNGRFVSADGALIGGQFPIQVGSVAQYPRVAYSPDVDGGNGGFLVTWQQSDAINNVFSRLVSYTAGLISPVEELSFDGAFNESGAAVAYSTGSREFMVVWDGMWRDPVTNALSWKSIVAQRVGVGGSKLGAPILITKAPAAGWGFRDPSIAYNPDNNEYLTVYTGWNDSYAFVNARRIAPVSGALLPTGDSAVEKTLSVASGTYITEVAYNSSTRQYLASWYQFGTYGVLMDAAGNILAPGLILQATRFTAYDALGLAYNNTTGTFMMVSHDALDVRSGGTIEDGATELGGTTGRPIASLFATQTVARNGNYYPKIAAAIGRSEWLMTTATDFAATTVQRLASTSSNGPQPLRVSLTANKAMPVPEGTPITFTANATGGTAPLQYQFLQYSEALGWKVAQAYSALNSYTWFPGRGNNAIQVWVRNNGSTAAYDAYAGTGMFLVTTSTAKVTSFTSSVALPPMLNVPVTWTAAATGGVAGVEYQFMRFSVATGWQIGQAYSPVNTYTWYPPLGTSIVQVWVRNIGTSVQYQDWASSGLFTIGSSPAKIAALTANVAPPSAPGVPVTWTAVGAGGAGALEYKFFLYNQAFGTWSVLRNWGASNQATWIPAPGDSSLYLVQVWVRTAGTLVAYEDWKNTPFFSITTSTGLTLTANRSLGTLHQGDVVRFTAAVTGDPGPWEYKFFTYNGTTWMNGTPGYSAQNVFDWVVSAGARAVQVWIRPIGSAAAWERWEGTGLFVVNP